MPRSVGVSLVPLDFAKLKSFFLQKSATEVQVCATLQALRWRLTRVKSSMRREVLMSFAYYDLLDCKPVAN